MVIAFGANKQVLSQLGDGTYIIALGAFAPKSFGGFFFLCCAGKDTFFDTLEPGCLRFFTLSFLTGQGYCVAFLSPAPVLHFQHPALNDVDDEAYEQHHLHQPHYYGCAHEMSGPVEHGAIIIFVEEGQIIENAGVKPYVNDQKGDQKQTR